MSTRALLLLLGMMVGCESEVAKNGDTDVPPPKGKEDIDCGDTDPEVYELTITNNGLYEFGEGSQTTEWPSILIEVAASDIDGDLTTNIVEVWYDLEVDGMIGATATQLINRPGTIAGDECTVGATVLSSILAISGSPPMDTVVEFGALVTDSQGNISNDGEPFTVAFHTPDSSGNTPN